MVKIYKLESQPFLQELSHTSLPFSHSLLAIFTALLATATMIRITAPTTRSPRAMLPAMARVWPQTMAPSLRFPFTSCSMAL